MRRSPSGDACVWVNGDILRGMRAKIEGAMTNVGGGNRFVGLGRAHFAGAGFRGLQI